MLNQGIITEHQCENVLPPPDSRCSDPFFALQNPDLCPAQPRLVIKPGFALSCELGSIQFRAYKVTAGVELDVTADTVFSSSDPTVAVIGVSSGNATGLMAGVVTIGGSYQGMTGHAELTVLAGTNCCEQQHVASMVVVDMTKSMALSFTANYPSKLAFAKAAAKRFITEIDGTKDSVGLMSFTDAQQNILSAPSHDTATVAALVDGITQTTEKTSFYQALTQAIAQLNATTADRKILYLISDGEDTALSDSPENDPFILLDDFKQQGGIVICLGVRSSTVDNGFYTLSLFSTGGFFVNAYATTDDAALNYVSGLKGYVCAGNCTPAGDVMVNQGQLNYAAFINWDVVGGHVDLLGNGFLDILPGNGLYVDLGGSTPAYNGMLKLKTPISLVGGHTYRLTVWLAGNQQNDPNDLVALVKVIGAVGGEVLLSQSVSVSGANDALKSYGFSFTPATDIDAIITIQQALASGFASVPDPRWGLILNEVLFEGTNDKVRLFNDNFDDENPVYVPPACGVGTNYVWIASLANYGYMTGSDCYGGYGCLSSPPGIQLPDPTPLSDVESGNAPPPQQWTSTKQACATCPAGTQNSSNATLVPAMTSNTVPSGVAFSSNTGTLTSLTAWQAFDGYTDTSPPHNTNWQSANPPATVPCYLGYKFAAATIVGEYELFANDPTDPRYMPTVWTFEGSNNGSTWTVLDSQNVTWVSGTSSKRFHTDNSTAYLYYRLNVTENGGNPLIDDRTIINEFRMYAPASSAQVCKTAMATSTISQAKADADATAQALALAQAALNCVSLFTSTRQCTARCPLGQYGSEVTKSATATSFESQQKADDLASAAACAAANADLDCGGSNNTQTITIKDSNSPPTSADPYPSVQHVSGKTGVITKVQVLLGSLSHTWPDDIHMVLIGPDGTSCELMRNAGDHVALTNVAITFDDAGAALPDEAAITPGTYKPSQYGVVSNLASPAPVGPYGTTLSVFNGKDANGSWALWVCDDSSNNSGQIANGWSLSITTA